MPGVLSAMYRATAAAAVAATAASAAITADPDGSCPAGAGASGSCVPGSRGGLASENLLLQRAAAARAAKVSAAKHLQTEFDTPMVSDEDGFDGGDIDEIQDTGCEAADVRRRRRADTMCSCRRRDSGRRYDGGWRCQNDKMVQEPAEYTNPVWAEEFNDERGDGSLNESRWEILYTGSGNGNNELQFYTKRPDNLKIEDGKLKIIGKQEIFERKGFTSGKIQTNGKGDWGPGVRIEVRAKLPYGVGTWPAIWMMPTDANYGNWPESGEIDIMEAVGRAHGKVFGTIHTGAYNHMKGTHKGRAFYTDFGEWHTYALHWHEDRLEWYTDGNLYNTFAPDDTSNYAKWPFNRRFYLILNLALGGNLGGPISFWGDQMMEVDYARVYCLDGTTTCAGGNMEKITCCDKCSGQKYCSQISGNCYDEKKRKYYDRCFSGAAECCSSCGDSGFCSPISKKCYSEQKKDYYESCDAQ